MKKIRKQLLVLLSFVVMFGTLAVSTAGASVIYDSDTFGGINNTGSASISDGYFTFTGSENLAIDQYGIYLVNASNQPSTENSGTIRISSQDMGDQFPIESLTVNGAQNTTATFKVRFNNSSDVVDSFTLSGSNNDTVIDGWNYKTFIFSPAVSVSSVQIDIEGAKIGESTSITQFVIESYPAPAVTYTLSYSAGANGTLTGSSSQNIISGGNGTAVTAVPDEGYHFTQWSDGDTNATRTDTNVEADISVTAEFAINSYTLNYAAGENGTVTGTLSQTVNSFEDGTPVTAVPAEGYHFVKWSDDVTDAVRTDTNVLAHVDVTAIFAIDTYTWTYAAGAHGSVTGTTTQTIDHGGSGTPVTAVPDLGYHFTQWSDGNTDATRTDTGVTTAASVTAEFAINEYTLKYAAGENGTVTGTLSQTVNSFEDGTPVTAVPADGYHFVKWSDDVTDAVRTDTNVLAHVDVTAIFAIDTYTWTYAAGAHGSVTGTTTQTIDHGGSGTPVTAVPDLGYHFTQWSDGNTDATRTDTGVTTAASVTAEFAINSYTLNYAADENGTVTGTLSQTVNSFEDGTPVTAVPADGYHFVKWSDDVTDATRTDTNVLAEVDVTAIFAIDTYTWTYAAGAHGSVTGTSTQTIDHGGSGTPVTAVPDLGYHFTQWSDGNTDATRTDTVVTTAASVTAEFAINSYTLNYAADENGTVTGTLSQTVNSFEDGTPVTAVPADGYHFVKWSDNVTDATRTDTNVLAEVDVTAIFEINGYTLNYTAGANGSVTGDASQSVSYGGSGTAVTAVPADGYHFVQWSDGETDVTRTDTNVEADISVTAEFAINSYTLNYAAGENGTVTGILSQTVNSFEDGTPVTAVPADGYHFVKWSDNVTDATRTDTNVLAEVDVTAIFEINGYSLNYTAGANGSVTGDASQSVSHGGSGTAVTAVPAEGYHFVQWSDGETDVTRTDTNVEADISVTAEFAINSYTLNYAAGENGTVTGTLSQTVNSFEDGTPVTAVPADGYHFVKWSDNVTDATRTDTNVLSEVDVTAIFEINGYTLNYTAGANGSVTGDASQSVSHGGSGTAVTAVPDEGYHFVQWSDGETDVTRTDTNVEADISVTAEFAINSYTLNYAAGENGTVTGTLSQTVNSFEDGTPVTAVPADGYHFVKWSDNVTDATRTDTNVLSEVDVTAIFEINGYTLNYTAGANGSVTGDASQSVSHGGSGTAVTAVPDTGYRFSRWSDGVTTATRTDANVTANVNVTAGFESIPSTSAPSVGSSEPESSQPKETGVDVLVNGKVESAGTASTSTVNNQTVTSVKVDERKLTERLAEEGQNAVITIPIHTGSDVVIGELNGQMIKNMEQQQAVLQIRTDNASYTIPVQQINIDSISGQIGSTVTLQDIQVQITIAGSSQATAGIVANAAIQGEFTIVAPSVDFTVTGTYSGKSIEVSKFNVYVERTIAIPDDADPNKITTGIVVEPDGTVRHVPTKVIKVDGKYFAQINSLTNSTYSVVWHPIEFKDVDKHWAKDAVNDLGSRMVINGIGDELFSPNQDITRAEFAAIVVRALGLKLESGVSPFKDVSTSDWYNSVIQTAFAYGLIDGFKDGTFRPTDKITREQAMVILAKAMRVTGLKDKLPTGGSEQAISAFVDADRITGWAKSSIVDCLQAGIVSGRTVHTIAPQSNITRAEVAIIVKKLLQHSDLI